MAEPTRMWLVFDFIISYKQDNDGNPPTRLDIAKHFGISRSSVEAHLSRLLRKGHIRFDDHGRIILIGGVYEAPSKESDL